MSTKKVKKNINYIYSSKRIEIFLDEIFEKETRIPTERFLTKFLLLQETVVENIADGKVRPMADALVPQFTATIARV